MELSNQIKKQRNAMNMSQEELAEKIYVTRQTISNWENAKSYPDIHSLILLSSLFNISLDQLIKGDIEIMKEEIDKNELQKFYRDGAIFAVLSLLFILSIVPLTLFAGYYASLICGLTYIIFGMHYALRLEKYKKKHDIQTYREIVAFTEGKKLDEIEKARESGKRPYQKVLLVAGSGLFTLIATSFIAWLLKSFIL